MTRSLYEQYERIARQGGVTPQQVHLLRSTKQTPAQKHLRRKKRLLRKQKDKCFYCEAALTMKSMTIDHKIPRSKGGTNRASNLVAACFGCNQDKGDKTVKQFEKWRKTNGC